MNRVLNLAVASVLLILLLGHMVTYQVRFNEAVIVTTFGSADASSVVNAPDPAGRAGDGAGLHFKWPWPIQQVARRFDTRIQVLETPIEQTSTRDAQSVVINTYVAWRISDPLSFYASLGSQAEAERAIRNRVRDSRGIIGNYNFDDLTNVDPRRLRLAQAEADMQRRISASLDELGYGVTIQEVGIKRVALPAAVTDSVFERMRAERNRLAQSARSEGEATRDTLVAEANTTARRIESFAQTRAEGIRAEGRSRAAQVVSEFAQDEEFAVYLLELDALRRILSQQSRFIIDPAWGAPFQLLTRNQSSRESARDASPGDRPQTAAGDAADDEDGLPPGLSGLLDD